MNENVISKTEALLKEMLDDLDPTACILMALSKDRTKLHAYTYLDDDGRLAMIKTLDSDPITLKGMEAVFNNIMVILGNTQALPKRSEMN